MYQLVRDSLKGALPLLLTLPLFLLSYPIVPPLTPSYSLTHTHTHTPSYLVSSHSVSAESKAGDNRWAGLAAADENDVGLGELLWTRARMRADHAGGAGGAGGGGAGGKKERGVERREREERESPI